MLVGKLAWHCGGALGNGEGMGKERERKRQMQYASCMGRGGGCPMYVGTAVLPLFWETVCLFISRDKKKAPFVSPNWAKGKTFSSR